MTLIASYITKFGIIQASDSTLTNDFGNSGFGQKVFPLPNINASLAYSGCNTIAGEDIDTWMNNFISASFFTIFSIEEFTTQLTEKMTKEMLENEISEITIVQIAGYNKYGGTSHAEHWHISNTNISPRDDPYSKPTNKFHFSNEFNSRTNQVQRDLLKQFDADSAIHQSYINGFPPERISLVVIKMTIDNALSHIWGNPDWKFKRPSNIFEFSSVVKLYFDFVIRLFPMSDYKDMHISGEVQTHLIPVPQDLWKD